MNPKIIQAAVAVLLGCAPVLCKTQDFSADVVYGAKALASVNRKTSPPKQISKIFVSGDKMRLETRGMTGTVLLVDRENKSVLALFPDHEMYQPLTNPPAEYFRVKDVENACPDWQKASTEKIVCEKASHEVVAGRDAVKYLNKSTSEEVSPTIVWIDVSLRFVIKWENANLTAQLQEIKEGAQIADLFALPSTYETLKPMKKTPRSSK